jgi:hypothetical protein
MKVLMFGWEFPPHVAGGCILQMWDVSEILRAIRLIERHEKDVKL